MELNLDHPLDLLGHIDPIANSLATSRDSLICLFKVHIPEGVLRSVFCRFGRHFVKQVSCRESIKPDRFHKLFMLNRWVFV